MEPATTDSTSLCTGCGLCCSGLLFTRVDLAPEEVGWAQRRRLPMFPEGTPGFRLPCVLLVERKCSDYAERPGVCRRFKCKLLLALEADRVDLPSARSTVARVHALAARVYPDGRRVIDPASESIEILLDLGELEALIRRDFHDRDAPTSASP